MPKKKKAKKKPTGPRIKAVNKALRYSVEHKIQCMNMFAQGIPMTEIAKIMGHNTRDTCANFKRNNDPMDWDEYKNDLLLKFASREKEKSIESMQKTYKRQQERLFQVMDVTAAVIIKKANHNKLKASEAIKAFFESIEEQRKLFLEPQDLYSMAAQRNAGTMAAQIKDGKGGEVNLLMAMNEVWEDRNPHLVEKAKQGEATDKENAD